MSWTRFFSIFPLEGFKPEPLNNNNNNHIEMRNSRCLRFNYCTAAFNTYAHVVRGQSCAYHMQHIERLSRAACVRCATKGQLSHYVWQSFNRICFSTWLKPLTDEGLTICLKPTHCSLRLLFALVHKDLK